MSELSDVAAEKAVLAGIFTYGLDAYLDVADLLTSSSFTDETNQHVWACLDSLLKDGETKKVDYPTFLGAAKALGISEQFDSTEDKRHIRSIMVFPVKLENIRSLAGVVKKLEVAREGEKHLELALNNIRSVTGKESIDNIIGLAEGPLIEWQTKLSESDGEGPQNVGNGLRDYIDFLGSNKRDIVGVSSGYYWYDITVGGGLRPGTVNVVGARPKTGKSFWATNIACRVAGGTGYNWPNFNLDLSIPVLQLDTEMTKRDQWVRQTSLVSQVGIKEIETGQFSDSAHKVDRIKRAIDILEKMPYDFLNISGQPFEETISIMRRWVAKRVGLDENGHAKPCLIIFDYLKLMSSDAIDSSRLAEFQVLGFMMTQLHNFAVRYNVPILTFVQLNRDGINVEDTSVASGSDRIIWLCSNFGIFKKKTDEELAEQIGNRERYNLKYVPIVGRYGEGIPSGDYINMNLFGHIGKLVEGPTKFQYQSGEGQSQSQGIIVEHDGSEIQFAA